MNASQNSTECYIRTKPSVISKIKQYVVGNSPKHVVSKVQADAGGVVHFKSAIDIPRNIKQVNNQKYLVGYAQEVMVPRMHQITEDS